MCLEDVARAVTYSPVKILGLDTGKLGTLKSGAYADIALCKLKESNAVITDKAGDTLALRQILSPVMTVRNGQIVYRNIEI
jgi:predicted amidohydrolase